MKLKHKLEIWSYHLHKWWLFGGKIPVIIYSLSIILILMMILAKTN